jgi:glycosyltransferase involved in cell wall biosynthesis
MPANRIVHLSKMTGTAGSEGHLLVLLGGLRAEGLDARLWILIEPDKPLQDYVDQAQALGIPVERIPIRHDIDLGLWRRLVNRFRETRPDMVHTHLFHADLYGITAARRAGVPWVVSSRHNDDRFRHKLPIRLLHRWLWRQTDAGIAISEAIRRFSITVEGAPADRIHTVHYGLGPAPIQARADARAELRRTLNLPGAALLVGSVCRLVEQKGLVYGLRGFAEIAAQIPDAHYVIAGDGPLREELEIEVRALKLAGRVHFLGWRSDAPVIFAGLDLLLAPSLWEGFGLVFLEAMALGVPVLSTRVSAIPEIVIGGETGWLVPPRDPDAIASALREALSNRALLGERGANGRRRLETQFTVKAMVEHTLAVYRGLEAER